MKRGNANIGLQPCNLEKVNIQHHGKSLTNTCQVTSAFHNSAAKRTRFLVLPSTHHDESPTVCISTRAKSSPVTVTMLLN